MFEKPAEIVNSYLSQPNYVELAKANNETAQLLKIRSFLVDHKPLGFEQCIIWAREQFELEYHNEILQLLHSLPKDLVGRSDFWEEIELIFFGRLRERELLSGLDLSEHLMHLFSIDLM